MLNGVDAHTVKAYYRACKRFDALLNDERNVVWNKSEPGEILCFDNRRVLHNAINDYYGQRRRMHRITVMGSPTTAYSEAA